MKIYGRITIVVILLAALAVVVALKSRATPPAAAPPSPQTLAQTPPSPDSNAKPADAPQTAPAQPATALPKLVDLGADKCIPCKMMAPILEDLKREYAGRLEVEFIDVWKDKQAAERYALRVIPTQIFFDRKGQELFRHEGFFSKEDILAQWKQLGITLGSP